MSNIPPAPAEPVRRPAVVTVAAAIMVGIAVLAVINAITTLATTSRIVNRFRELADARSDATETEINNLVTFIRGSTIAISILLLLFAALLIVLALGDLRGSNVSRILTWVVCGLGLLCGCCGVFGAVGSTRTTSLRSSSTDSQTAEELGKALSDAYPGWWPAVTGGLSGLQLLGYLAVAVLLALPVANAFFRKPVSPPQWQPPAM